MTGVGEDDDLAAPAPAPRPPRPRKRGPRKVTLALALLMALVSLLVGVALGYTARGGKPPEPLQTLEREIPVVTAPVETTATQAR